MSFAATARTHSDSELKPDPRKKTTVNVDDAAANVYDSGGLSLGTAEANDAASGLAANSGLASPMK